MSPNDTDVSFYFTEGWLGLYELEDDYQIEVFDNFTVNKINQSKNVRLYLNNRKILTQILKKIKKQQKGLVSSKLTHVSFNFTEDWFRNSGLYALEDIQHSKHLSSLYSIIRLILN